MRFRSNLFIPVAIVILFVGSELFASSWNIHKITSDASTTCRRRMAVGFYSPETKKTYFTWSGPKMNPQMMEYDHYKNEYSSIKDLGSIGENYDTHSYTHLIKGGDSRLLIYYSIHSGPLWQIKSPEPLSIEGDWVRTEIKQNGTSLKATYPMPVITRDGKIYIFFRQTLSPSDYRPLWYVASHDNGKTWTNPQKAIDYENARNDHLNEIYIGNVVYEASTKHNRERILLTWTNAGGGPTQHKHDYYHKNIYFAYYDPANQHFYNVGGKDLGRFIDNSEAEAAALVYDSGNLENILHQVDYRAISSFNPVNGHPLIFFYDEVNDRSMIGLWNREKWELTEFVGSVDGLENYQPNGLRIYSRSGTDIDIIESIDGGNNWVKVDAVPYNDKFDQIFIVDNHNPEVILLGATTKWGKSDNPLKSTIYTAGKR